MVALLFLIGQLFDWSMVIVIPLVSVAVDVPASSHWVDHDVMRRSSSAAEAHHVPDSCRQRDAATSSAIWMVLSAAPLRRLSPDTNSARPRSPATPGS